MAAILKSKMAAIKMLESRVFRSVLNSYDTVTFCAKCHAFITFRMISVKIGAKLRYY